MLLFCVSEADQNGQIQAPDRQCERHGNAKDLKDRSCPAESQATKQTEQENRNQQGAEPKANATQSIDESASARSWHLGSSPTSAKSVYVLPLPKTTSMLSSFPRFAIVSKRALELWEYRPNGKEP